MNTGTKSILFGVHQFILHPIFVTRAWFILYQRWPQMHEWCAIVTHDLGYWGCPNMDGDEGEQHPERVAAWWRKHFGVFGERVAIEVLGHSRYHAGKNNLPLSELFRPDKMATALYPRWLYLLLGNLSGEVHEYMGLCNDGKYQGINEAGQSQTQWVIEMQAHCAHMGIQGDKYHVVRDQMQTDGEIEQTSAMLATVEIMKQCQRENTEKQLLCEGGSIEWHAHETIDDWLHDQLCRLGD